MAPHSSTLAWKIPQTEEPGRLQSMGSQSRTRLSDVAAATAITSVASKLLLSFGNVDMQEIFFK